MPHLEQGLSSRRRGWILITAIAATVMFSWASIRQLNELVDLQHHQLPLSLPQHTASSLSPSTSLDTKDQLSIRQQATKATATRPSSPPPPPKTKPPSSPSPPPPTKATTTTTTTTTQKKTKEETLSCNARIMPQTDYWGEALKSVKVDSVEECCFECRKAVNVGRPEEAVDCNVFVYCENEQLCGERHRECWLKHLPFPDAVAPASQGIHVGWTTGMFPQVFVDNEGSQVREEESDRRFHIVISAQGPAVHWQSRVHYYWYRKIKKKCEEQGKCQMGGFTRLLHSGVPDDLMQEIPTFVAQMLPPEHPDHGYVVLNRPWAFVQWVKEAKIPEKYVLMSEPDHLWLKPMPNMMIGRYPAAFPFFYIEPSKKEYFPVTQKFVGPITRKEGEQIAPIGNAPTMLAFEDLQKVAPLWFNLSIAIHNDPQASKAWGWVQEMYAFTIAMYKAGIRNVGLHLKMMAQPPWDSELDPYYILHYTYGMDYTLDGEFTPGQYGQWRFDKRSYAERPPPQHLGEPPKGMSNHLVRHLIRAINEATEVIPGWKEYAETGVAVKLWNGTVA